MTCKAAGVGGGSGILIAIHLLCNARRRRRWYGMAVAKCAGAAGETRQPLSKPKSCVPGIIAGGAWHRKGNNFYVVFTPHS